CGCLALRAAASTAAAAEVPEVERAAARPARGVSAARRRRGGDRDAAVERTDDAVGHGSGESEGSADGDGHVADVEFAGVRELGGLHVADVLQFDDGEVVD